MNKKFIKFKLMLEKFFIYELWQILLVVSAISLFAWIFDKPIETIFFCISHLTVRPVFTKQSHSGFISVCMIITLGVVFIGISTCLPISVSLLSAPIIAFVISWIGYAVQDRLDAISEIKLLSKEIEILKDKIFNLILIEANPKEKLLRECQNAKLSDRDTKLAILYYYEHKTPKDIWLWYCQQKEYEPAEWNTIYQILWRIGKKLNNK